MYTVKTFIFGRFRHYVANFSEDKLFYKDLTAMPPFLQQRSCEIFVEKMLQKTN